MSHDPLPHILNDSCVVVENETSNTTVIPFAVNVADTFQKGAMGRPVEQLESLKNSSAGRGIFAEKGIVGTIILMNKTSAYIWFGWGQLQSGNAEDAESQTALGKSSSVSMGSLNVGMPRTNYQGAFAGDTEASTSKLIGSENEDEDSLGRNMASRLSSKLGISIIIACNLEGAPAVAVEGLDSGMVQHQAAAQAERKILQILRNRIG
jgi:hypothetical protein